MYFMTGHALEERYHQTVGRIEEASCSSVGIMLGRDSAEYPLWAFLDAPRPDLDAQWIVAGTASASYVDPNFVSCAVIVIPPALRSGPPSAISRWTGISRGSGYSCGPE
jgi:hypothetical protein